MEGLCRLVRSDREWLSLQLILVEAKLDRRRHHGAGVLATTDYANQLRRVLQIQGSHHHHGRRRYVDTERK